jgi:hypothetical protein
MELILALYARLFKSHGIDGAAQRFAVQLPRARRETPSKSERSRARSGQLQRRVRRSGRQPSGCHPHGPPHQYGITLSTTGLARNHAPLESHPAERAFIGTTPIGNHAVQNEPSARRALIPRPAQRAFGRTCVRTTLAQRAWARRSWHNGPATSAIRSIYRKKVCQSRPPDAERPAHQPPRARRKNCQNAYDLAREAVGCRGVFGGIASMHSCWNRDYRSWQTVPAILPIFNSP